MEFTHVPLRPRLHTYTLTHSLAHTTTSLSLILTFAHPNTVTRSQHNPHTHSPQTRISRYTITWVEGCALSCVDGYMLSPGMSTWSPALSLHVHCRDIVRSSDLSPLTLLSLFRDFLLSLSPPPPPPLLLHKSRRCCRLALSCSCWSGLLTVLICFSQFST